MAFDFPNAPTEGATYAPAGGPSYTFTQGAWRAGGGAGADLWVNTTGDTMTGTLNITDASLNVSGTGAGIGIANGSIMMDKLLDTNWSAQIQGRLAGVTRWSVVLGNGASESGSNAGSDFEIQRSADNGTVLGPLAPININRATGTVNFGFKTTFNGIPDYAIYATGSDYYHTYYPGTFSVWTGATGGFAYYCNSAMCFSSDWTGNFTVTSEGLKAIAGPWASYSDARIKTVTGTYTQGLDAILQINPVLFELKGNHAARDDPNQPRADGKSEPIPQQVAPPSPFAASAGKEFIGIVAQDVETIMPEMVRQTLGWIDDLAVDDLRILDLGPLTFALVNAVKELSARVEALEGGPIVRSAPQAAPPIGKKKK